MSLSIITHIIAPYSYDSRNPVNFFWVVGIICTRQRRKLGRRVENKPHASYYLTLRVSVLFFPAFRTKMDLTIMIKYDEKVN